MAASKGIPAGPGPSAPAGSGSRTLEFGGASLGIAWDSAATGEAAALLFNDLPAGSGGGAPLTTLRLETRASGFRLRRDEEVLWRGRSIVGLTAALLDEALRDLSGRSWGGVVLHAAAVTSGGRSVTIPGESGAGKTSLCAWLLRRGFGYLTDELVYVESSSRRIHCFPRPLHVKRSGIAAIERLLPADALASLRATPTGGLVPHRLLNPHYRHETPEIGLVLLPRFDPSAACELRPLSKAETGRRLMACLVNARNLDGHGFPEATRISRAVEAFALSYGSFEQLGPALDPLLDRHFAT